MQEVGRALYRQFGTTPENPETLIVVTGAPALRDSVKRWVARNRYRVSGRRDTCWVPTREQAARIL